jgi:hypothetical protein
LGFEPTDRLLDRLIASQVRIILIPNPLHVLEQELLPTPIIEFGGATIGVTGYPLGHLQRAIVFQVVGDAGGAKEWLE